MKQTAVEWLFKQLTSTWYDVKSSQDLLEQAKEMEKKQQGYSEEEVLPLLEMLQKCKEYFLLKTDKYSDERADAIIDVIEQYKKK